MAEIIAIVIFIGSFLGMVTMVWRKIPILLTLPEVETLPKESLFSNLKRKIKKYYPLKNFSLESFLQKVIYKIRILVLKADVKTWHWLQRLREKAQKKKVKEDHYWEEIKKAIKEE